MLPANLRIPLEPSQPGLSRNNCLIENKVGDELRFKGATFAGRNAAVLVALRGQNVQYVRKRTNARRRDHSVGEPFWGRTSFLSHSAGMPCLVYPGPRSVRSSTDSSKINARNLIPNAPWGEVGRRIRHHRLHSRFA